MELLLHHREMLSLAGDRRGVNLTCLAGHLWITQQGDGRDHLLQPGASFASRLPGEIVVTALADSRLANQAEGSSWQPALRLGLS